MAKSILGNDPFGGAPEKKPAADGPGAAVDKAGRPGATAKKAAKAKPSKPEAKTSKPRVKTPKPGAKTSKPGAKTSEPGVKTPKPGAKIPKRGAKPPKAAAKTPKPEAKTQKPEAKTQKPAAKASKPDARTSEPAAETVKPGAETWKPVAEPERTDGPTAEPAAIERTTAAPSSPEPEAPRAVETETSVSEYGPSIDRAPPGLARRLASEVRHLEGQVRTHLSPSRPEDLRKLPFEFVWRRWRALAMRDRSDHVDEFGRDPRVSERLTPALEFLYRSYFRVEARGLGHIPDEGRALIVCNHSGSLPYDAAMLMHGVRRDHPARREVRPLTEDFVFHFPYLGTLINRIGGVRACQENAQRLLEKDQLVAVFPEGIKGIGKLFNQRYQLQRFGRGGFIKLALLTDSPIIPAAVVGAEEIHPMVARVTWLAKALGVPYIPVTPTFPLLGPLGLIPLPTRWYVAFGPPLYFSAEYGPEGASDRILVNKLAEQVRQRIQEMVDQLLQARKSVFFG